MELHSSALEEQLSWTSGTRRLDCRVCAVSDDADLIATITVSETPSIEAIRCRSCGSIQLTDSPRDFSPNDALIDSYVEFTAGIGTIAESLGVVDPSSVKRFLDVGCGYPFSLDLAQFLYGWQVVGVEPSPAGARGATELRLDVRTEYLAADSALGAPFDLILASEVVEHVTDPFGFLSTIRGFLAHGGALTMTTPAAEIVDPSEDANSALLAISPGYHVFLASVRGMELLLKRCGFTDFTVRRDGGTLRVIARSGPLGASAAPAGTPIAQGDLDRYYEWRARRARRGSSVAVGLWTRLLRLRVARGEFRRAERVRRPLFRALKLRHGINLRRPSTLERNPRLTQSPPWSVAGSAFALGIIELLARDRPRRAVEYFAASEHVARMAAMNGAIVDGDSTDLLFQAPYHRAIALARFDPAAAVSLSLELGNSLAPGRLDGGNFLAAKQCRLLTEVVARGAYSQATPLAAVVAGLAADVAGAADPESRRAGLDALYSLGISALNTGDAAGAAKWFGNCVDSCDSGSSKDDALDLRSIAVTHLAIARARLVAEAVATLNAASPHRDQASTN